MVRLQYGNAFYLREIKALVLLCIIMFIGCSVYSYDPEDCSLIHYTTRTVLQVQNWCGGAGAQCAALLWYLCGSAAYMLCVVLLGRLYALVMNRSVAWDQLVAAFGLVITSAGLCQAYRIDLVLSEASGGLVGIQAMRFLSYFFEEVGSVVCVHVGFYICLIVLCRLSFVQAGVGMAAVVMRVLGVVAQQALRVFGLLSIRTRLWQLCSMLVLVIQTCVGFGIRCVVLVYKFFWTLIDGTAFEGTDLMVPGGVYAELLQDDEAEGDTVAQQELRAQQVTLFDHEENEMAMREEGAGVATQVAQWEAEDVAVSGVAESEDVMKKEAELYTLPHIAWRDQRGAENSDAVLSKELEAQAILLEEKLKRFGVTGTVVAIKRGPVVTLFEYQPDIDAKISKILALEDDLAMALKALSIRIIAPIPGRSVVGFEVSNAHRADVLLADTMRSAEYRKSNASLPLILGQDTVGNAVVVDLARMPHLLIAGSTGSGKSVGLNAMLVSLLCARTPDELKLILIDPKRLEFTAYEDIAHLLFPIITDTKAAVPILQWVATEMDARYTTMAACGVRNIFDYNVQCGHVEGRERMPFIVVIIDELADLMITVGREVEGAIARITQMARAAGIHLVVATQRPSVDVITGFIKVNFPSRISFRVTSRVDSRTILDCGGADKLLGRGDMLFLDSTVALLRRVHGAYVSDAEIAEVTDHIRAERAVSYLDIAAELQKNHEQSEHKDDMLYEQVISYLDEINFLSISSLQRKFKIGYNRSARIIDQLEGAGRIMPADGSKPRRIIK